ncbi:multidrug transporter [Acidiplasma aeolicum]|uniref:Multidrug transporter n=2 Tax=Acidiplasma aeolicum TaxID=507754 RepID=A0A0Q0VSB0_9ARCH|nr:multidrug transporter [Acidiplasma aeolicum]
MSLTFSVRASNNLILTTIPLISKYYLNFNSVLIGILSASAMGSTGIMSALINSRLDSKKRRKLFISSVFIYSVFEPLFYFSNPYNIWLLVIFSGFFFGSIMPNIISSAGTIKDKKTRERALTLYTLSLSASLVIGPIIESYILLYFNLYQLFLFFIPFDIIAVILSFKIRFPDENNRKTKRTLNIFKNNGFKLSVFNNISYDTPFALILTFGGIFARTEFNAPYSFVEILLAGFFGLSFLSRFYLSYRPVRRLYITTTFSILLTITGLIMVYLSRNLITYFIIICMLGIPHGLTFPTSLTALSRSFNENEISVANTYFYAIMMFLAVAVPSISGLMVYSIGLRYTFLLFSVPVIILFILILYEYRKVPGIKE